ncbi:MAG: Mpo1-like protein [Pseudomonadota bacterium]|nr:hypothetical protein [Pseudomonadales bacterium]MDY6920268.1 Mpo1-like protein [Pseudomonadota bacterium]
MRTLTEQLAQYAEYHRDKRNIASHFVGIPMILVAVAILLSRPQWSLLGLVVTPALLVSIAAAVYYLKLDRRFGLAMAVVLALCLWVGYPLGAASTGQWLGWGVGLFVVGWIIQFIGHVYERRKPAFVDDLIGLAIGPLFVVAEAAFLLGLRPEVQAAVEQIAGPTVIKSAASQH